MNVQERITPNFGKKPFIRLRSCDKLFVLREIWKFRVLFSLGNNARRLWIFRSLKALQPAIEY
jgi:hypothetical protein